MNEVLENVNTIHLILKCPIWFAFSFYGLNLCAWKTAKVILSFIILSFTGMQKKSAEYFELMGIQATAYPK